MGRMYIKRCLHCTDAFKATSNTQKLCSPKCKLLYKVEEKDRGCWEWKTKLVGRYAVVPYNGKGWKASRLSYTLFVGKIGDGLCVCHRCDNPKCYNPSHLFLGTQFDNMRDMINKGRDKKALGIENQNAKLTPEKVKDIFLSSMGNDEIGKKYGVSRVTASDIRKYKAWKVVTENLVGIERTKGGYARR